LKRQLLFHCNHRPSVFSGDETTDRQFFPETKMQTQTFIDKADIGGNNWFFFEGTGVGRWDP
jgi:hypothetical protein